MSMIWPPQSVKIVSTPSFLSALATRWPPETTLLSRSFCFSVSSAVVVRGSAALGTVPSISASKIEQSEPVPALRCFACARLLHDRDGESVDLAAARWGELGRDLHRRSRPFLSRK